MQMKRLLVIGVWALLSSNVLAHPGSGIVVDRQGNVFVGDINRGLLKFTPDGKVAVVLRECVSRRLDLADPDFERSLPDATHGNCHLLLALGLTIERLTAFAEVIERCGDRIVFGYRPVHSVCLQPVVLSINGAIATQHGIES